jgi:hypothetical protein
VKTVIQVEIEHDKPLPEGLTDVLAERAYTWSFNKAVPCDVSACLLEKKPEPLKAWEVADAR